MSCLWNWNVHVSEISMSLQCPCLWNVHVSEMAIALKCPCLWNVHFFEMSMFLKSPCHWNVHVSEVSCLWNVHVSEMSMSLKCPVSEMSMSEMSNTFSAVIPKNILPLGSKGITSLADIISMLRLSCLKIISSFWLIR